MRNTTLDVSEIGFGMWTVSTGWWGKLEETEALRLMEKAFDLGVTYFDAADSYGNGYSERLIAKAFAAKRDQIVIATKVGYDFYNYGNDRTGQREIPQDFSSVYIRGAVDRSLERLNTDRIDVLQLHNIRQPQIADDELWATLDDLRAAGKIRYGGVTLGPGIGWLYEGVDVIQQRNPTVIQHISNILEQFPANRMYAATYAKLPSDHSTVDDLPVFMHGRMEVEPQFDTNFIVRVPHSSGLLEDRYTNDTIFAPGDHRLHRPRSWLTNGLKKVERLRFLTAEGSRTLSQAAILWTLAESSVVSCLPNIYNEDQLREFTAACDKPSLSAAELQRIEDAFGNNFNVEESPAKFKGTMRRSAIAPL